MNDSAINDDLAVQPEASFDHAFDLVDVPGQLRRDHYLGWTASHHCSLVNQRIKLALATIKGSEAMRMIGRGHCAAT
jgi:hypothetical protein